jgi:translation initiation factor 3 subunit I
MDEYTIIETKQFRGCGFMTVSKYNNIGDIIYIGDKDSKIITAIDTQDYNIIGTFEGHNGIIWSLDISKNDDILITASGDLTIGFFNAKNGIKLFQTNERGIPKYVSTQKNQPNQTNNLVAIICEALSKKSLTYISIYDLNNIYSTNFNEKIKLIWNKQSKPNIISWFSDSEIIVGCDDGKIFIINIFDINIYKEFQIHSNSIKSIAWNKSFTQILTGSLDCTAKQIDILNWDVISTYKSNVPVICACWNYNNRKVIIGGGIEAMNIAKTSDNDLNIKIYRTSDQKLTHHINSHFGPIRFIDKSPCSKNFMTASQDGSVKIYFMNEINKQEEKINEFKKFGNGLFNNLSLNNETNKMINLSWKPQIIKKQKIQKWIPGMPVLKNENNELFNISNLSTDINNKLEELKKQEEQNSTIRITNLPRDIKIKDLYELFDLYGRIEERGGIRIKDYENSTMAFLKYLFPEAAHKAMENMNGYVIDYCIIQVEMAKPRQQYY